MSQEIIKVDIPATVQYTKALFCKVTPPQKFMSIEFKLAGDDEPFRIGKIIGRECPEIAAFMFRPSRTKDSAERFAPLKAGDKVKVIVKCYAKGDKESQTFEGLMKEEIQVVEVQ